MIYRNDELRLGGACPPFQLVRKGVRTAALGCAGLGAIWSSSSFAQAASPAPQVAPTPSPDEIPDIVVTAQKREESSRKVPISIVVLSGKDLDQQTAGGTLEALTKVPGISQNASDAGSLLSIAVRGVSANGPWGVGGAVVGYYIDNVPFGTVRSAYVPNTNDFDMARIEVLRGPQGTLYGASALNGVVHIVTNEADPTKFEFKTRLNVSAIENGAIGYRGDVAINVPIIPDKLAIRVVGSDEFLGGWVNQPVRGVKNANSVTNKSLRVKVDARPTDYLRIDLLAWISREHEAAAPYADESNNQYTPIEQPETNAFEVFNGKVTLDLPFMSISSSTSYMNMREKLATDFSWLTSPALPTTPGIQAFQLSTSLPARIFAQEFLVNSSGSGVWRWSAGAFYRKITASSYQTLPFALPGSYDYRDDSESTAEFFQITRTFADDHVEITAGLRNFNDKVRSRTIILPTSFLPYFDDTFKFHAVTPRVVATWLPDSSKTFYVSYSQGFRSGFGQPPLTLASVPSVPPTRPDKLHNYEIGSKGSLFGGKLSYDVSVYYMKWNDVQISGSYEYKPNLFLAAEINGPSASGFGTDISVTLRPVPGLQLGGTLSYNGLKLDGNIYQGPAVLYRKGQRLLSSARDTESFFLNYLFDIGPAFQGRFNAAANFRSKLSSAIIGSSGTSMVFDSDSPRFVNASFDLLARNRQMLSFYVENIGNWRGLLVPRSNNSPTTPFRPRPRTYGIQYSAAF
jgi:iron complex outermembrane receptor protein